jgi:hypothetical protein
MSQPEIERPTVENLADALLPSVVTAAIHTTAINATRSAYSTSEAPRWVRVCAWSQTARYTKWVITFQPALVKMLSSQVRSMQERAE